VAGENPQIVPVVVGTHVRDTAYAVFDVSCTGLPGRVRFITRTTGVDLDPDGYTMMIDGSLLMSLPANGTTMSPDIGSGAHGFELSGIAANCAVTGENARTVTVIRDVTIDVTFDVTCVQPAVVEVTTRTIGNDQDANGFRIVLSGASPTLEKAIAANATTTIGGGPAGTYRLELRDVAANCEVSGESARTITLAPGTVQVTFAVECTTLGRIAYAADVGGNVDIYTAKADGSDIRRLTTHPAVDAEPSWSSAGRIAFVSYRDGNGDIYVMDENGSGQTRLTTNPAEDISPAWTPDGTRMAFVSFRAGNAEIQVMDANGANVGRLTDYLDFDFDPAWSQNGARIVFGRSICTGYYDCHTGINIINSDGTGVQALTSGWFDVQPAWSPNGAKIAFARQIGCGYYYGCEYATIVMSTDGTAVTFLPGDGLSLSEPSWSPNGSRLLVATSVCDYYGCTPAGLRVIRADGSDPVAIIPGSAFHPVWRP
jgi:TolB protein